jgi:hypothetical protein
MGAGARNGATQGAGAAGTAGVTAILWSSDKRARPGSAGWAGGGSASPWAAEGDVEEGVTTDSEPEFSALDDESACDWPGVLIRWGCLEDCERAMEDFLLRPKSATSGEQVGEES